MKRYILCLFSIFASCSSYGQQANHFHSWWVYDGTFQVQEKVSAKVLYAWSRNDFLMNWQQSLLRFGLAHQARKEIGWGGGYEWIERFPYGEQPLPEQITIHRFYQRLTVKNKIGQVGLTQTLRFNQEQNNNRFRYFIIHQIGVKIPIRLSEERSIFLILSEGIFINHGEWANKNYFGQNRVFAGFKIPLNPAIAVDFGY
ncbi:MAG: DUF2490 domain-containing protein, partial [Bacteroidota bacterium]